jgi:ketosteroid isomerase-like protein
MIKKSLIIFAFILSCALLVSAQSNDEKTIKDAILKVLDEQVAAWNNGDIEGFMKGYWNSPEMTFVSGATITKGWQPTLERYQKNYNSRAKMGFLTFSDLEITVLSRKSAVVLGKWALQRENDKLSGVFTLTFRKFKDGWKIILDHTS